MAELSVNFPRRTSSHQIRSEPEFPIRVIDYRNPSRNRIEKSLEPPPPPLSALTVTAMILSILCFPCLVSVVIRELQTWLQIRADGRSLLFAAPVLMAFIALVAWARIERAPGRLRGKEFCYFAWTFCAIWLAILLCLWLTLRNMHFGPRD